MLLGWDEEAALGLLTNDGALPSGLRNHALGKELEEAALGDEAAADQADAGGDEDEDADAGRSDASDGDGEGDTSLA